MSDLATPETTASPTPDVDALRECIRQRRRLPISTYRLQLHKGFAFADAREIVPYLAQLGVTDCYCSPYLQARPGSTHGYDITDHNTLNAELGTPADYQAFVNELARHQMGQVLDFVPNHMGVDPVSNRWWRDVLEHGPASPYARFFDIDWNPIKPKLRDKVLLPFLGDHYGLVLERGELQVAFDGGAFILRYFDQNLPLDPGQFPRVLRLGLAGLQADLSPDDSHLLEYLSIVTELEHLPSTTETDPERVAERQRETRVARERLSRLVSAAPRIQNAVNEILKKVNGQPGEPASYDLLHELLELQPYRLAYWKTALHEINYRRFFDINDLAGVRMEEPAVFAATHGLILRLIREGKVTGLRLDHLDGLFDPAGYLDQLQEAVLQEWAAVALAPQTPLAEDWRRAVRAWREEERKQDPGGPAARPFYLLAEKILSEDEALPAAWPLHGTSGYDFLNDLNRLFVDPLNHKALQRICARFSGHQTPYAEVVYEGKKLITWTALASELNVLAHALNNISEGDRRLRDFTRNSLREALREFVAGFPVYRTYINAAGAAEADRRLIDIALTRARWRNPAMEPSVLNFVRDVLLPSPDGQLQPDDCRRRLEFAMKFQQYTGPVQAKGVEDTTFYRYNVLLSLNEVGGDPQRGGGTPTQFHEANRKRREHWPHAMLATATHDTKRGEDGRARLNVLSEIPQEWRRALSRWSRLLASLRTRVNGAPAPDRNDEYLFYQTLLGAWPAEPAGTSHATAPPELVRRVRDYLTKAIKEAKVHTSWINPNEDYDNAMVKFVERALTGPRAARFLGDFLPFQQRLARLGMINSLSQVVLKTVSPGVPDFYQGTELWDFSLVDPDNRRPVDYELRKHYLHELDPFLDPAAGHAEFDRSVAVTNWLEHWDDGRIKLFVTTTGLRLRQRLPLVFLDGNYQPLIPQGDYADHVVALARRYKGEGIIAVVPRLVSRLLTPAQLLPVGPDIWQSTWLPIPPEWQTASFSNLLTGERIRPLLQEGQPGLAVAEALRTCPVALLRLEPSEDME